MNFRKSRLVIKNRLLSRRVGLDQETKPENILTVQTRIVLKKERFGELSAGQALEELSRLYYGEKLDVNILMEEFFNNYIPYQTQVTLTRNTEPISVQAKILLKKERFGELPTGQTLDELANLCFTSNLNINILIEDFFKNVDSNLLSKNC